MWAFVERVDKEMIKEWVQGRVERKRKVCHVCRSRALII